MFIRWRPRPKARRFAVRPSPADTACTERTPRAWQEGAAGGNFCFSCGHVASASRKEMVFVPVQNSRRAVGRVIFKKTGDGMEKKTKVGRENREDA